MLERLAAVTICVADLARAVRDYGAAFDYALADEGATGEAQAAVWYTPAMAGKPYALLAPGSGDAFRLRLVETLPVEGFAPLKTHGWNAVELLVQDPDALAARLADSAFEIIGMPYDLGGNPDARAMQLQGPDGEIVYCTRISGAYAGVFGTAQSFVDRAFICVAGGPDHAAIKAFYRETLGQQIAESDPYPVTVLSRALGLPRETTYPMASARLGFGFSLELDGYPPQTAPRPQREGELPPGIAMITATCPNLDALPVEWRAKPRAIGEVRTGVTTGAAGEWIEIIEEGTSQ